MPGRKRKPFVVKVAEGNRGHRKLKPGVEPPSSAFEPPFELDEVAMAEWRRVVSECYWIRASESFMLAERCRCVSRLQQAEADIATRGLIVRSGGRKVKNPSIQIAREYRAAIAKYDIELGMSTASRQRLNGETSAAKAADSVEDALCG